MRSDWFADFFLYTFDFSTQEDLKLENDKEQKVTQT